MPRHRWLVLLALPLLTACAPPYEAPTLSPRHPASPQASEAPWSSPSSTLAPEAQDANKTATVQPAQPRGEQEGEAHHESEAARPEASEAPSSSSEAVYTCPMHPEVVRDEAGTCPKCGMQLDEKKVPR